MLNKCQKQQHSVLNGMRAQHQEYFQDLLQTPIMVVVSVVIRVSQKGHRTDTGASVVPKVCTSWASADNGCPRMAWWDALTWSVTSFLAWSKSTSTDSQVIPSTPSVHRVPRGQGRDGISCLVKIHFTLFQPFLSCPVWDWMWNVDCNNTMGILYCNFSYLFIYVSIISIIKWCIRQLFLFYECSGGLF